MVNSHVKHFNVDAVEHPELQTPIPAFVIVKTYGFAWSRSSSDWGWTFDSWDGSPGGQVPSDYFESKIKDRAAALAAGVNPVLCDHYEPEAANYGGERHYGSGLCGWLQDHPELFRG